MKSQKIPEHKLNFTTTISEALESAENNQTSNAIATEQTQTTETTQVNSNEAK